MAPRTMTTTITEPPATAGGDGIGLSLTVSTSASIEPRDGNQARQGNGGKPETAAAVDIIPSFIPPSVGSSPIPYEENGQSGDRGSNKHGNHPSTEEPPSSITSIMREQPTRIVTEPAATIQNTDNNQAHVTALEERVRDLEEKLSTLSMLLMQQNNKSPRQSPRHHRKTLSSSPDSSGCSDSQSSASPPSTPFRSLQSFSTLPSSNVPVLESPTPISSLLPYEQRGLRYPRDTNLSSSSSNNNSPAKMIRGIRNNLSYHILHSSSGELDLRSSCDEASVGRSDTGSEGDVVHDNPTLVTNHVDDNFANSIRVPTLDSLPGSSRTSPILSSDPVVNSVLSPDSINDTVSVGGVSPHNKLKVPPPPPFLGKHERDAAPKTDPKLDTSTTSENSTSKHQKKKSNIKSKWLDYLNSVQESNYDTDKQMEEFVKVPSAVEALLSFGFWISVDSFLYTLTMLPLRFVYSIFLLTVWIYTKILNRRPSGSFQFHRHNSYHLIQVSIIYIIYAYVLKPINISIMYHWIRVQSMVKLYLLIAIVEVFDRLMCSLGQDCLDSLYWNTTRRPRSSRLIVSALVVLVYTAVHSFLLFVHVATLNVAMNSDDQALLSLLIGGNFAEIKSTVFKKYNKATLFKIAASDICERFKLALFLFLVLTLNASQGIDKKMLYNYLSMCGIVWCAEWLSDWLKHSFITKFNYIASGVYAEYSLLLAGDVSGFGHEGENLDKSHAVVKRLGLAQIPLVCVMTKYLKEAYKYQTYENQPQTWLLVVGGVSIWLLLLVTKLFLASCLERMSRNKLEAAPEFSKHNATVAKKKN